MAEQNKPTAFGEAMHKWIVYGSIGGVGIVILGLRLAGLI
jgi:hypothetical protein